MAISQRRFELRARTQIAHERLDNAIGGFGTMEQYQRYLASLRRFRTLMERSLQKVIWPANWLFRPTAIAISLHEDANDLNMSPSEDIASEMDLSDDSALLGTLYVLEGSTLGARVLRKRAAALGLDEAFGARHLAVMSKDIAQWQSFLLLLDEAQNFDVERAAASANAVFALALQCFESDVFVAQ